MVTLRQRVVNISDATYLYRRSLIYDPNQQATIHDLLGVPESGHHPVCVYEGKRPKNIFKELHARESTSVHGYKNKYIDIFATRAMVCCAVPGPCYSRRILR